MFRFTDVLDNGLVELFNDPGPYYTSYPTLSEWTDQCADAEFGRAIAAPGERIVPTTLYVHFPFCPRLCYYCICNATISRDRAWIRDYLKSLHKNLDLLFAHLNERSLVETIQSVHIGGGSPSFMEPEEFHSLAAKVHSLVGPGRIKEFTVEVDPRTASAEKFDAYHELGVNRLSFGIQDFDAAVQQAINRVHPFEEIQRILSPDLRRRFPSINFDILYGLPLQTRETFRKTIERVIRLSPERVTLLKYAHVPQRRRHQKVLEVYERPDGLELPWLFFETLESLTDAGWEHVGIDNFAKPTDALARAKHRDTLGRTFNGFAPDRDNNILGVGPTCTFQLESHYFQNDYDLDAYMEDIEKGRFPVLRGHRLSREDRLRRDVIQSILCSATLRYEDIEAAHGIDFPAYFSKELNALEPFVDNGIAEIRVDGIFVTELGRGFLRNLCKEFDTFLTGNRAYTISGP